jgi:hypothetical protein
MMPIPARRPNRLLPLNVVAMRRVV